MPSLADCSHTSRKTKLKISEHGRSAIFINPEKDKFCIIRADGCLYQEVVAADYIICGPVGDLIAELKGSDVNHALEQVIATMKAWRTHGNSSSKLAGLIVCARVPKIDTKIQRAKLTIARGFGTKLHICSRNMEHDFNTLFLTHNP